VRVNDPTRDRQFIDQTTQSETTIAVHGSSVAVGSNDSQKTLLFLTAASDLTGSSFSTHATAAVRSPTAECCPTRPAT
jgi:hypothetical protein